jgi:uncharacterized cupredoxin-like copper-binding protein
VANRLSIVVFGALLVAATLTSGCGGSPAVRIQVTLTEMAMDPATMSVPRGQPVTFVITNAGIVDHEFFLGDEAAQAEHEDEMLSGASMHGHHNAAVVKVGATEELTYTFEDVGETLAGCHVPGHYPAGMVATILVS